jgi:four helix bundle protein
MSREIHSVTLDEEFAAWQRTLPLEITSDPLWTCAAYRLATFVADRAWEDVTSLVNDPRTATLAGQFAEALGSIGANYAEAYSRSSSRDRCRFYEYSLGSARESRAWCFKGRHVIGDERTRETLQLLTRITQLVTVTIVRERKGLRAKRLPLH